MLHFDISDFLLSGLRHPIVLFTPLALTILIICLRLLHHKYFYDVSIFVALVVTFGTPILIANMKISSCGEQIIIDFKEGTTPTKEGTTPTRPTEDVCWLLYGSTNKVIFTEKLAVVAPPQKGSCSTPLEPSREFVAIPLDEIKEISFQNSRPRGGAKLKCVFFQ